MFECVGIPPTQDQGKDAGKAGYGRIAGRWEPIQRPAVLHMAAAAAGRKNGRWLCRGTGP